MSTSRGASLVMETFDGGVVGGATAAIATIAFAAIHGMQTNSIQHAYGFFNDNVMSLIKWGAGACALGKVLITQANHTNYVAEDAQVIRTIKDRGLTDTTNNRIKTSKSIHLPLHRKADQLIERAALFGAMLSAGTQLTFQTYLETAVTPAHDHSYDHVWNMPEPTAPKAKPNEYVMAML